MRDAPRMTDARESTTSGHLDPLQRVTEQMTVHHTLDDVLSGITRGLVNHADAALARIWLYTTQAACAQCSALPADGVLRARARCTCPRARGSSTGAKDRTIACRSGSTWAVAWPRRAAPR